MAAKVAAEMTSCGRHYVTYIRGSSNLVLAAPHGGTMVLDDIPTRHHGRWNGEECDWRWDCPGPYSPNKCYTSLTPDTYTYEITQRFAAKFLAKTARKPHVILLNVHRNHVDVNRPRYMGTASFPKAERIWDLFHGTVKQALSQIKGPGLYLDIHGHTHKHNIWELGYRVQSWDLNHKNFSIMDTSIRHLASRVKIGTGLGELLWGDTSLGSLIQDHGFNVVPSKGMKSPGEQRYFRGGYDTLEYGSQLGGQIDGIQVEIPLEYRNEENLEKVSEALAESVAKFWTTYYKP